MTELLAGSAQDPPIYTQFFTGALRWDLASSLQPCRGKRRRALPRAQKGCWETWPLGRGWEATAQD